MMVWGAGWRAAALRVTGVALAALLVSCGGGQQVDKFVPQRILSFGDENSVIEANGSKYTVNALTTAGALDCATNPVWNQYLASGYLLVFPQCNPHTVATTSNIFAQAGATSSAVKAQIDGFTASDSFSGTDLVTVLAGSNDVFAQYQLVKANTITEVQATAVLQQAGTDLAGQVNRIAAAGGKVLISTILDMGTTPFAHDEDVSVPGNAALLTRLSKSFNDKLRVGLLNDGHKIGLVLANETFSAITRNASSFVEVKNPVCDLPNKTPDLLHCTTDTLVDQALPTDPVASGTTWLWADAKHLSAGGQATLGSLALTRATGNPF